MSKRVYLAGPITGLDYEGASDWREEATKSLRHKEAFEFEQPIQCFSPMRGKPRLREIGEISGTGEEYRHMGAFYTPKGIVTRDKYDCTHADIVLMNLLGAKEISKGTLVEVGWADALNIPIVLVMEPEGNVHEHVFLDVIPGFRVATLAEGVEIVKGILLP